MKKTILKLLVAVSVLIITGCNKYESVANDPTQTRIYTLDNGLKVYMSVNQDEPRIQAHIAVRAGSKNDPHETTGLAHYLEHIMFKGTSHFGTTDYEAEKPLLDEIENLYEKYRATTDKDERRAIYHVIDSLSYMASSFFVANEYDKLMATIGAKGTNAYTGFDVTCYTENIPSNEVERWAMIQSDRFKNLVIRGFHTELETVYEEFNVYLTDDNDKCFDKMASLLCKKHPYGTQTTIGTQEHLKNPSIKNIKEFYNKWYVPNNVAICLSGDLDPEATIEIINKYFGDWKPSAQKPEFTFEPEEPMTEPVYADVVGQEKEAVWIAWRFPGANNVESATYLHVISELLNNGKTGIIDVNLLQQQKVLNAYVSYEEATDYTMMAAVANPNEGQSLEDVKDLLLENINKIAAGEFDEEQLEAIINNVKRYEMRNLESNRYRVSSQVDAFIGGIEWKDMVNKIDRLSKVTKEQIVDFAKQNIHNGYAVIYKRKGVDNSVSPIEKPEISPIQMNRDKTSEFFNNLAKVTTEEIQPKFVNLEKDMAKVDINGNEFLYIQNTNNGLFSASYFYPRGQKADKVLDVLGDFFDYLRTDDMSAEEIKSELYKLACDVYVGVGTRNTSIGISGLAENQEKAIALVEKIITEGYIDPEKFDAARSQIIMSRANRKTNQKSCFNALQYYAMYGADNYYTHTPNNDELMQLTAEDITNAFHEVFKYRQVISFYTPVTLDEAKKLVEANHKIAENPLPESEDNVFTPMACEKAELYLAPYQAANIYLSQISVNGEGFDIASYPATSLFNDYFGSGMNSVVFQELREARGLCYGASASYRPSSLDKNGRMVFSTYIASQNDKLYECLKTFNEIIEDVPVTDNAFEVSKSALLKRIASSRTLKTAIFSKYMQCVDLGIDHDINEDIYKAVSNMTIDDIKAYHAEKIKGRTYRTAILGDEKQLDPEILKSQGEIRRLSLEEIFGY
ncbi:MAG: insulinase family protein [Bacteroidia bacterium]|nr:insulinase family protein [Bacteroidia bacterium]